MSTLNIKRGKIKGFALVRDKDGNPKFDNLNNIPPQIWDALTNEDKTYIEEQRNGFNTLFSN